MDDPATVALVVSALIAIGAVSGVFAGLFGIGGGIVIVPALYYLEGLFGVAEAVRMHTAVGTSLAVIVVTSIASVRAHWRHGAVDRAILRSYGPGVLGGVAIGTGLSAAVPGAVLTAVFAGIALIVAVNMATGEPRRVLGPAMPGGTASTALGGLTGVISTMAGIGGGAMTVAILTLYSVAIHVAVGTASAVGVLVSLPGALGFAGIGWGLPDLPPYSLGYVNLAALALIAPVTALMAPAGARLAHRLPRRILARAFALFLGAAALRMIWNLVSGAG